MWIICQADDSHEMPSIILSENSKFRMSSVTILLSALRGKIQQYYKCS